MAPISVVLGELRASVLKFTRQHTWTPIQNEEGTEARRTTDCEASGFWLVVAGISRSLRACVPVLFLLPR